MTRLALPIIRPVDGGGNPYPGGSLTFYEAGASTTPKPVFADSALSVSLGSKVNADGEGLFVDIYYDDDIRIVLKDKTGVIKNTKDIYGAGTIDTGDIANDAVTTPKIVNGAVTVGKIEVLGSAEIITSNGVANSKVPVSGDLTMNSGGAFAIGNEKITEAMLSPAIAADLSVSPLAKDGVKLSNGTDTDHDIDITAGKLTDSTSSVYIGFPAATISIDVTIGSGSGGFPSSGVTLSPETRYRVFICSKADGTDPLAAFDDSPSAVNARADMGTGSDYTLFRRIGWVKTDASTNIVQFDVYGAGEFVLKVPTISGTQVTSIAAQTAIVVDAPPNTIANLYAKLKIGSSNGTTYTLFTGVNQTNSIPSSTLYSLFATQNSGDNTNTQTMNSFPIYTDSSSQVFHRSDNTNGEFDLFTNGWFDSYEN